MRKQLALAVLFVGLSEVGFAVDLSIPAGQVYTISAEQSDLRLDRLAIGDNAQIKFAEGVSRWRVAAKHVSVGNNVVIDGRGASVSTVAAAGAGFAERAKDCDPGATGKSGATGAAGGNGVNFVFWWGVDSWGSAKFLTDGGNGGNGGAGGRGQDGGKVNRCNGPAGGAGGSGGAGGNGGKAGDIALSYFDAAKGASVKERLTISAGGGQPGIGGAGASGGVGAEGRFQRTATSELWFPAGQNGAPGVAGNGGVAGGVGVVSVDKAALDTPPLWFSEGGSSAPADRGTVQALQKQVQALQASGGSPSGSTADQLQALQERMQKMEDRIRALEAR